MNKKQSQASKCDSCSLNFGTLYQKKRICSFCNNTFCKNCIVKRRFNLELNAFGRICCICEKKKLENECHEKHKVWIKTLQEEEKQLQGQVENIQNSLKDSSLALDDANFNVFPLLNKKNNSEMQFTKKIIFYNSQIKSATNQIEFIDEEIEKVKTNLDLVKINSSKFENTLKNLNDEIVRNIDKEKIIDLMLNARCQDIISLENYLENKEKDISKMRFRKNKFNFLPQSPKFGKEENFLENKEQRKNLKDLNIREDKLEIKEKACVSCLGF